MFEGGEIGSATRLQWTPVQVIDASGGLGPGGEGARDEDPILLIETERASVKQLVVQGTQSHAVVQLVGSAEVEPPDVGRIEPYRGRTELPVIPAEGALAIPGFEDRTRPCRRSSAYRIVWCGG
jgi:hypothetical protein